VVLPTCLPPQARLDAGASIEALRRFNTALRGVRADNWGECLCVLPAASLCALSEQLD
jgi:hypothetical protein